MRNLSSYLYQLNSAIERSDLVSINHRIAAILESYFDIIFAINRLPHPGEKRLVEIASKTCLKLPTNLDEHVQSLIESISSGDQIILNCVELLIQGLDILLVSEKYIPNN